MSFLTDDILKGTDWRALERAVARIVSHCGWRDVAIIGRSGDMGADVVAVRTDEFEKVRSWVIQVKAVTGGNYVGPTGLNEALQAQAVYGAHVVALATNGEFTKSVQQRKEVVSRAGYVVKLWNGEFLRQLLERWPSKHHSCRPLRPYQSEIVDSAMKVFESGGGRVQYVVATGLGKTVIAAQIAARLWELGYKKQLVLCHAQDLALQLEQGFWPQIPKEIPTRYFFNGLPPTVYEGINFGLYQTLLGYLSGIEPGGYDVVIVDEAHHALAYGFRKCLEHLAPKFLVGMTATPWRGDGQSIDEIFGEPIARVSLADGMALGFLSEVDYRLYCDNIDWAHIQEFSEQKLTLRDLNKRLFLPQRDDAIIQEISKAASQVAQPHIAIFSPSIDHATRFAAILSASGLPCEVLSGVDRVERRRRLMDFSTGKLVAVTAVDVMNEGIDVPDVNILVFLRTTHSRRIFVQQLGRGLRLAPNKNKVVILDFVSDIRRMADVIEFDNEAKRQGEIRENLYLKSGVVRFSDARAQRFVEAWLSDVADLGATSDSERLAFPDGF